MDIHSVNDLYEDDYKPSFFELVAQDQLRDLLGPVTRYVLSVFAQSYPRYLLKIVNWHDECFAVLMLIVERYYLKNWSGSFAEHFYGLKRRRRSDRDRITPGIETSSTDDLDRMTPNQLRWSLFGLVCLPYLRTKARDLYEKLGGGLETGLLEEDTGTSLRVPESEANASNSRQTIRARLSSTYKLLYPYVNATYEIANLFYGVQYLFEQSPYWRPFEAWLKLDIRRLSGRDYQRMQQNISHNSKSPFRRNPKTQSRPTLLRVILRMMKLGTNYTLESLKVALPFSIFIFKFLEWWYSSSNIRRSRNFNNVDQEQDLNIKPPISLRPHPEGVLNKDGKLRPLQKGSCPICRSTLVNSTAFPSGWVCCYKCAHSYVVEFGRCPVTWYPSVLSDLRKIVG